MAKPKKGVVPPQLRAHLFAKKSAAAKTAAPAGAAARPQRKRKG